MTFELAYDLPIQTDKEVVFILANDRHRKVRLLIVDYAEQADTLTLTGHSLGSSYTAIKSAKRDEPPVVVKGEFQRAGDNWSGSLTMVR